MSNADLIFKKTIINILQNGVSDEGQEIRTKWLDGTPAHTIGLFGVVNSYNLQEEFPIITLRPTAFKSGLKEILWIYSDASNDVNLLEEKYNVNYWRHWANEEGTLGTAYGYQVSKEHFYKDTGYMNQLDRLIYDIKNNPTSRRLIMNLYNHSDLNEMTLYPCCFMTMWNVKGNKLNMTLVQRSSDFILANNINLTQYALLQHMIAQVTGYEVGTLNHYINDCHIYMRHMNAARELLKREPRPTPKLIIDDSIKNFYDFKPEHFTLEGYNPNEQIQLEVAI